MTTDDKAVLVRRFFDEVCNGRKLDVADSLVASTHTYHDPSSPWVGAGPEGIKQLIGAYHRAFPDARWTVHEIHVAGDTVFARWTGRGTQKGELTGIPPTGKKVAVDGIWMYQIAHGKIHESWNAWDTLGMLQQLGVVPALSAQTA